jgi:hypothetical protein
MDEKYDDNTILSCKILCQFESLKIAFLTKQNRDNKAL